MRRQRRAFEPWELTWEMDFEADFELSRGPLARRELSRELDWGRRPRRRPGC